MATSGTDPRFPFHELGTPEHQAPLPRDCDLVVIGGGVAGVCTAIFAARRGLRVVLCEKGRIGAEQSGRNWGWIRQQGRDAAELPLMIEANRLWHELTRASGEDIGLKQIGITYLTRSEAEVARYEDWIKVAADHGLDTRMLARGELARIMPGGHLGGMTTPSDMKAEPWLAVPALARLASREGVTVREACAVRTLETEAGHVSGVVTEAGVINAPAVAVCAGAWSRLFLARHGVRIPQLSVKASVAATQPLTGGPSGGMADERLAYRPRADGGYSLAQAGFHELFVGPDAFASFGVFIGEYLRDPGNTRLRPLAPAGYPDAWGTARSWAADSQSPFERMRILDPAPSAAKLEEVRAAFEAAFPSVGPVRIAAQWAGMIDVLPDVVPIVDAAPKPGLWLCTGLSGHGFGIGPALGRVLADRITGHDAGHDMHRFRFSRFADGSQLEAGPAL